MKKILFMLFVYSSLYASEKHFKDLEVFNKALYLIESQYVKKVDTSILIEGAIKGMLDTLDPYSTYLSKELMEKMNSDISGHYGGVGIDIIQKNGVIIVVTPFVNSPAHKAGIRPGDHIMEIDHTPIYGADLNDIDKLIQGKNGTVVKLGILREGKGKLIEIDVKRDEISVEAVKGELLNNEIIFIRLMSFQKNCHKDILALIKKMKKSSKKIRGILLDLRSNPGGLLEEAVEVSSLFLADGVVVSTIGRSDGDSAKNEKDIQYVLKNNEKELNLPMAVLINGASASAAEIVAGALQDHKRALIMGNTSFGKASVQTVAKLNNTQGIKLTVAQYMTPSGSYIHGHGITPDIPISELDSNWIEERTQVLPYVHLSEIRGNLNAIIETPEELKERQERKLNRRIRVLKGIQAYKERNKVKNEEESDTRLFIPYEASKDYQVTMATHFLKSYDIYRIFYDNQRSKR